MKRIILVLYCVFCIVGNLFCQNEIQNLEKYWQYRSRLRKQFVVVSSDVEKSGVNIPAITLTKVNNKYATLDWDDANANMSHYLALLATEYRLLKNNNQSYRETLKELIYALLAIERLDLYSEYYRGKANIDQNDINGFFLRDDITPSFWNEYYDDFGFNSFFGTYYSVYKKGKVPKQGISQDNVFHLLEGISLIKVLVDKEQASQITITFRSNFIPDRLNSLGIFDGGYIDFSKWMDDLTTRLIRNMQNPQEYKKEIKVGPLKTGILSTHWYIKYPGTNDFVEEGSGEDFDLKFFYSYGLARAGNKITGIEQFHYDGSENKGDIFKSLFGLPSGKYFETILLPNLFTGIPPFVEWKTPGIKWDDYKISSLGAVSDVEASSTLSTLRKRIDNRPYEHLPLIYLILHGSNYQNLFSPGSEIYNADKIYYESLLNVAPCSWPHTNTSKSDYSVEWSSNSRLVWPERLGNNDNSGREYSGLDYMVLHNLYCLVFGKNIVKMSSSITNADNFTNNTLSENGVNIRASNIINGGNVTYQASNSVVLLPGFATQSATLFTAKIIPGNPAYNYVSGCDRTIPLAPLAVYLTKSFIYANNNESVTLTANATDGKGGNYIYTWYRRSNAQQDWEQDGTGQSISMYVDGGDFNFKVEVTNGTEIAEDNGKVFCNNCIASCDDCQGTQALSAQNIEIFPNPSNSYFDINVKNIPVNIGSNVGSMPASTSGNNRFPELEYTLYDPYGVLIFSRKSKEMSNRINSSSMREGIYHLNIRVGSSIIQKTVIVDK